MKTALLALLLTGCAIPFPESSYAWRKTHDALPHTWHIVPQSAVQAYCSHHKGYAMACAYWIKDDHCWIFTASQSNMMAVKEHEEKHCAGWNH